MRENLLGRDCAQRVAMATPLLTGDGAVGHMRSVEQLNCMLQFKSRRSPSGLKKKGVNVFPKQHTLPRTTNCELRTVTRDGEVMSDVPSTYKSERSSCEKTPCTLPQEN
jgi:hypothetical protein